MIILLLRHGEIDQPDSSQPIDDPGMALSDAGVEQIDKCARGMMRLGITFDVILCSTYLRARQTAVIVATRYGFDPALIRQTHALDETTPIKALLPELEALGPDIDVLCVGHGPDFHPLISVLCTGSETALQFQMKRGGLAKLVADDGVKGSARTAPQAILRWLMTPRQLRNIRKKSMDELPGDDTGAGSP